MTLLKRYFIAGLMVLLPLWITFEAILFLMGIFDRSLRLIPDQYQPEVLLGFAIPGFGLIVSFAIVVMTGMLVANILGSRIVSWWERFLSKIPLVRSIYTAVKQIVESFVGTGQKTFQQVYLVEYPRKGLWTLGFKTSGLMGEAQTKTGAPSVINLFIPTTPNPTSGFFIMVNEQDIVELEMSVDDALKMLISGGVVVPPWQQVPSGSEQQQELTLASPDERALAGEGSAAKF
ncbi:Uncharacterized membrane protein [Thiomicrospira sp. ALE5]|nr:DUF502 domain-containing protein [Thiomicrospira sp. ALE5]SFR51182.1 Uncharacterized membrane protein [Thiomicrospira sp. ALE5]